MEGRAGILSHPDNRLRLKEKEWLALHYTFVSIRFYWRLLTSKSIPLGLYNDSSVIFWIFYIMLVSLPKYPFTLFNNRLGNLKFTPGPTHRLLPVDICSSPPLHTSSEKQPSAKQMPNKDFVHLLEAPHVCLKAFSQSNGFSTGLRGCSAEGSSSSWRGPRH